MSSPPRTAVVVDTNVFGAGLTPTAAPLALRYDRLVVGRPQIISFQTIMELESGALIANWGEARRLRLAALIASAEVVWPGPALTTTCASLRAACTKSGHALGQGEHNADLWIAATAIHLGLPLIAEDGIFDGVPGLRRERP